MNRCASSLSDFFEVVQATLNRNAHKKPIEEMSGAEVKEKLKEEYCELIEELKLVDPGWQAYEGRGPDPRRVEREAADLAVCALAAWIWARRGCQ